MRRRTGLAWCSGWAAMTSGVVEQLGMEMMPWCHSTSAPLTSGTTSGTAGSIRKADPSSMTTAPASTAAGASRRLTSALAEMKTMSTPRNESSVASSTTSSRPATERRRPAERREASSFNCGGRA